jgi:hypothetical protein
MLLIVEGIVVIELKGKEEKILIFGGSKLLRLEEIEVDAMK